MRPVHFRRGEHAQLRRAPDGFVELCVYSFPLRGRQNVPGYAEAQAFSFCALTIHILPRTEIRLTSLWHAGGEIVMALPQPSSDG